MLHRKLYAQAITGMLSVAMLFMALPMGEACAATSAGENHPAESQPGGELSALIDSWTASTPSNGIDQPTAQADPSLAIYLTFDDGPDPKWTPQVLSLLDQYHAKATFYMIGRNAYSFPELVLQLAENGQFLGNHSFNHADLSTLSYGSFYAEVADTTDTIRTALAGHAELAGQVTPCLRPPYGAVGGSFYDYTFRMNYAVSMWQIDTLDWAGTEPEEILSSVVDNLQPFKVVLMHDGGEKRANTIAGLHLVLHELTMRGYQFLPYCTANGQAYNP